MIEVGQKVKFDPFEFLTGFGASDNRGNYVTGTVVYVNKLNKWFPVEFDCNGVKQRHSFKFCQIGKDVRICGK